MSLDNPTDYQGFLDLINFSNFINIIVNQGYEHKIQPTNKDKVIALINLSKKINPEGFENLPNYNSFLTPVTITKIQSFIADIDLTKLNNLVSTILTAERVTKIKENIKAFSVDNTLQPLNNPDATINIPSSLLMVQLLTVIDVNNFAELVNSITTLKFLDVNNFLNVTNLDKLIQSFPSSELTSLINNIPTLETVLPNFPNYVSVLNNTYLSPLINVVNAFCTPCIGNFLNFSGLKTDILTFLNIDINALPDLNTDFLKNQLTQFDTVINALNLKLDSYIDLLNKSDTLTSNINDSLSQFNFPGCPQVTDFVKQLEGFKLNAEQFLVSPIKNQITGLKAVSNFGRGLLANVESFKALGSQLDC